MAEGSMAGGATEAGADASGTIARVTKGDKSRTMMHASVANEVIDAVNALTEQMKALKSLSVSPQSAGKFQKSDGNLVLVLNTVACPTE